MRKSVTTSFLFFLASLALCQTMVSGAEIIFDSSFESGNGTWFTESPGGTANVTTEADPFPASAADGDYFYFSLANVLSDTLPIRIDFRNDRSGGPKERQRMPYLRPYYSYDQINWSYVPKAFYENGIMFFNVPNMEAASSNKVYIALAVPYTYSQLQKDIYSWVATGKMTSTALGHSSGGREMYYLTVGSGLREISITARAHPKEPESSWVLKGMLDFMTSNDPHAIFLRSSCKIHVFPMVNPDGVYEGRFRSFLNGENANRDFDPAGYDSIDEEIETYLIHRQMHALQSELIMHVDMHSELEALRMYRDSGYFQTTLESAIEDNLATYNISGYWPSNFQQKDNITGSVNVPFRYGLAEQYGLDVMLLEGGVFKTGTTGHLTTKQLETAGKEAIESILEGVIDHSPALGDGGFGPSDPNMGPDGTSDDIDGNDPNYDGNQDGTADSLQENVTSIGNFDNQSYVTLESPAGTSIRNFKASNNQSPTNPPSNVEFLYGFLEFSISGLIGGDSIAVNLYLSDGEVFDTYFKYGPTPSNPTNHWYEFLYDGQTGAIINGNIITLHLIDGIRGDDDLTANGTITDIGGPGLFPLNGSSDGGSDSSVDSNSGGGGGCFVSSLLAP